MGKKRVISGVVICLLFAGAAGMCYAREEYTQQRYKQLGASITQAQTKTQPTSPSLARLLPSHAGAWLTVVNTPISYPVALPTDNQAQDWYLSHDIWDNPDPLGCPYLDTRSSLTADHLLVFGHNIRGTNKMFAPLAQATHSEVFSSLSTASLITPQDGKQQFAVLCALQVHEDFSLIQQFNFINTANLQLWIAQVLKHAQITSPQAQQLAASATQVLTLVTCAGSAPGGTERTLVVFVNQPKD